MGKTRITTGLLKGRQIEVPDKIRTTQGKIRKAVFDILQLQIQGADLLELYAGSGAVGIEALSNGARVVVFAENNKHCLKIIERNLVGLGFNPLLGNPQVPRPGMNGDLLKREGTSALSAEQARPRGSTQEDNAHILAQDAIEAIEFLYKEKMKFDIIFLDPPYYEGLAKKTLQKLSAYDILSPQSLILVEHSRKDNLEEAIDSLSLFKQKRYGDTLLSFYERSNQ